MKKPFSLFLVLLILCSYSYGLSEERAILIDEITFSSFEEVLPPLDEEGYLKQTAGPEFVYANPDMGRWLYLSPTLQVEIVRYQGIYEKKPVVWYESDIKSRGEYFQVFSPDPEKPAKHQFRPELIAQKQKVVYAQNGDFFTYRTNRDQRPGLIIRKGRILHHRTNRKMALGLPPLDEMAFYPNGEIEVNYPKDLEGEDYVNKDVIDVVSFGPILIKDGIIDSRLEKSYTAREPRSALGMIAPGHYMGFYMESRNSRSNGCDLAFVAHRMKEKGCTLAMNLDGGQTAAMVFMGKTVMEGGDYNGYTHTRKQQDIIGIGQSNQVKEE